MLVWCQCILLLLVSMKDTHREKFSSLAEFLLTVLNILSYPLDTRLQPPSLPIFLAFSSLSPAVNYRYGFQVIRLFYRVTTTPLLFFYVLRGIFAVIC